MKIRKRKNKEKRIKRRKCRVILFMRVKFLNLPLVVVFFVRILERTREKNIECN